MLFENELPKDESPIDDTKIVQVLLYYSEDEALEFKRLSKAGMKELFPEDFLEKGNVSDFLLKLLKRNYATQENINSQTS